MPIVKPHKCIVKTLLSFLYAKSYESYFMNIIIILYIASYFHKKYLTYDLAEISILFFVRQYVTDIVRSLCT